MSDPDAGAVGGTEVDLTPDVDRGSSADRGFPSEREVLHGGESRAETRVAEGSRTGATGSGDGWAANRGAPGALVVIISGPSGVGKDTIIAELRARNPGARRHYVVTCATRERRRGEHDGVDYHFLSQSDFARMREAGALLEANDVHGNWYGTPRDQVVDALRRGEDAILKIDVKGAHAVRARVPEALLIFVVPPSPDELRKRLVARSTETPEQLERRFADAAVELASQGDYDHVVVNETGEVGRTAEEIEGIIAAEHAQHPGRRIRI